MHIFFYRNDKSPNLCCLVAIDAEKKSQKQKSPIDKYNFLFFFFLLLFLLSPVTVSAHTNRNNFIFLEKNGVRSHEPQKLTSLHETYYEINQINIIYSMLYGSNGHKVIRKSHTNIIEPNKKCTKKLSFCYPDN